MSDYDKIKITFFAEGQEIFENLDALLLDLENDPSNTEILNSIFRNMHTLKGSCGMFGFNVLERAAHFQEDLLDCLRAERLSPDPEIIDALFDSIDQTRAIFEMYRDGKEEFDENLVADIEKKIKGFLPKTDDVVPDGKRPVDRGINEAFIRDISSIWGDKARQAADEGKRIYQVCIRLDRDCLKGGIDPLALIRRLRCDGEVIASEINKDAVPPIRDLDPTVLYLNDINLLYSSLMGIKEVSDIFEFALEAGSIDIHQFTPADLKLYFNVEADSFWTESSEPEKEEREAEKALNLGGAAGAERLGSRAAIKIDAERLDNLVDLVGEMVIAQTLVAQDNVIKGLADSRLEKNIGQLTKITKNIQDYVMSMRMLPLSHTFQKMSRLVRDVAKKVGKDAVLKISGEDTEVDKTVIDEIGDPLIHILRNAVDHGIEKPEERIALGKPKKGTIELNAFHQGGNVVIEIKDDGKGLSRENILKRARYRGLITDDANLSDNQVYSLIFEPGFSTSETITELSGRGVGLDVVKKSMERLRGAVDVRTTSGGGTVFTIKLPLTLAIIDGMVVTIGSSKYIIPTLSVESSLRPLRDDITVIAGKGEMVKVRGNLLPLIRLHELLNVTTEVNDPCEAILIVVEGEGKRCCLMVDNIIGHQQAVIKSLGESFRELQGISGCTILGDGKVGLIIDVGGIIRMSADDYSQKGGMLCSGK